MSVHVERYCPRCRRLVQWGRALLYGRRVKSCRKCGSATKAKEPKAPPRALKPISWRRAAVKAAGDLTPEQWETILAFYGGRCAYGEEEPWQEQDHCVPISKGGQHTASNIVPCCHAHNQRKGRQAWWPRRRHPFMEDLRNEARTDVRVREEDGSTGAGQV